MFILNLCLINNLIILDHELDSLSSIELVINSENARLSFTQLWGIW